MYMRITAPPGASLGAWRDALRQLPEVDVANLIDPHEWRDAVLRLASETRLLDDDDRPYVFLILQSAVFGGKPVWWDGGKCKWRTRGIRKHYDSPYPRGDTRHRSKGMQTFRPSILTLLERLRAAARLAKGVRVHTGDICAALRTLPGPTTTVYVDPPYRCTENGYTPSVVSAELLAKQFAAGEYPNVSRMFISEYFLIAVGAVGHPVAINRQRGARHAGVTDDVTEMLYRINADRRPTVFADTS